ncbi:MAG TPA: YicC/YloC family endoribonuclease [Bacteroidota bacterium]
MIASMTGFGRGESSSKGISVSVEIRSVNSRYLEVSARLPRSVSTRENEIKEILRKRIFRGKLNVLVSVERENGGEIPLKINAEAARSYLKLMNQLKKATRLKESVKLEHLLKFSEIFEPMAIEETDEAEWSVLKKALSKSIDAYDKMRQDEGAELKRDFVKRVESIEHSLADIDRISRERIPVERTRLRERIQQLMGNDSFEESRLELEIALMADKLDVTEEVVRFRSHNKFFLEALDNDEAAGRKLNFLVQEMNREANTIGSKSSSTEIAHLVVGLKEELEKIREQLQNIE